MVPLLPAMTKDIQDPYERVSRTRYIKNEMRKAAIVSLYSPNLAPEFLQGFALPDMQALMQECGCSVIDEAAADIIVQRLSTITVQEIRMFPGTIGEYIGLRYRSGEHWLEWNGDQWLPVADA